MTLTIHYEQDLRCANGCGTWVNRLAQTCNTCLVKAEQRKDAAEIKAELRARLDPGPLPIQ